MEKEGITLNLKRRIEKLENLSKNPRNEQFTLYNQSGERVHGDIVKLPDEKETGIAIIEGKRYTIAIDISISELLSLNLGVAQLEESMGFKITPETLFLRRDKVIGGVEFLLSVCE
jgi:hypothetical protein